MPDIFSSRKPDELRAPLAYRVRPTTLDQFVGQEHIIGPGTHLCNALQQNQLFSMLFYGPPGTGKTALAQLIAAYTEAEFLEINAAQAKVEDIRKALATALENQLLYAKRTILFIDEIHRFNKAQQDALLPDVERGTIILIGATTENPFFAIIPALISRLQIFEFQALTPAEVTCIIEQATRHPKGLAAFHLNITAAAMTILLRHAGGDARIALNLLEQSARSCHPQPDGTRPLTAAHIAAVAGKKAVRYDRDQHYDIISAFIKSVRGSDPDAAIYWLARMLYAGEDPRFIARRLVILASEDIGPADPYALPLASAAYAAAEKIGLPEVEITLSHVTIALACAPKSNSALAIFTARKMIENGEVYDVPAHLKDSHYAGAQKLGRGTEYKYPHDHPQNFVSQQYWEGDTELYTPSENGYERHLKARLQSRGLRPKP